MATKIQNHGSKRRQAILAARSIPKKAAMAPPLLHMARQLRDVNTGDWFVEIDFQTANGRRETAILSRNKLLHPTEIFSSLLSRGAMLPSRRPDVGAWAAREAPNVYRLTNRAGWVGDNAFVIGNRIVPTTVEDLVVNVPPPRIPGVPAKRGSLKAWQKKVARWARYSSRLRLAICVSLAAPLLKLTGCENGEFSFLGKTSTGKSLALLVGNSVFRSGARDHLLRWDASPTALSELAAEFNDLCLCLDEPLRAKTGDAATARRATTSERFKLISGRGKILSRHFGVQGDLHGWRALFMSASDDELLDEIIGKDRPGIQAEQVRTFNIPSAHPQYGIFERLPKGYSDSGSLAVEVEQACAANYGHALRLFVKKLMTNRKKWIAKIEKWRSEFMQATVPVGDPIKQRSGARFALVYAAGRAAIEMNIVPWEPKPLLRDIKACFADSLAFASGATRQADVVVDALDKKLTELDLIKLVDRDRVSPTELDEADGVITRLSEKRPAMIAIKRGAFEKLCLTPQIAEIVLSRLAANGRLVTDSKPGLRSKQIRIPGIKGRRQFICLLQTITGTP